MSLHAFYEQYFPFWSKLADGDKQLLCENTAEKHFDRSQPVHDNMGCTGLFIVRSGRLRLYMLSEDGKEITLYRLFAGDVCVLSASCVLNSITFDVFIDAEEESDCVIVGGCAFAELSERNPEVKIFALEAALVRFSDVMWVMQQILFMSLDKRLAIFLLDEISKRGGDTVRLTHEQIARYIGSAREVVTRMVKYFVSEGLVESSRGGIRVLDKSRLRRIAS
jgi:CRP/FNR family transcriptional regulator